jgi:predicted metal-dependent hydrolase
MTTPKAEKIAAMLAGLEEGGRTRPGIDRHYAGYFEFFNRGLFYEAHEALEQLWLAQRGGTNDSFYKGLIQLAAAFVHLRKDRPGPAAALFKLALTHLRRYPAAHERLDVREVLVLIERSLGMLDKGGNPLTEDARPVLQLLEAPHQK